MNRIKMCWFLTVSAATLLKWFPWVITGELLNANQLEVWFPVKVGKDRKSSLKLMCDLEENEMRQMTEFQEVMSCSFQARGRPQEIFSSVCYSLLHPVLVSANAEGPEQCWAAGQQELQSP